MYYYYWGEPPVLVLNGVDQKYYAIYKGHAYYTTDKEAEALILDRYYDQAWKVFEHWFPYFHEDGTVVKQGDPVMQQPPRVPWPTYPPGGGQDGIPFRPNDPLAPPENPDDFPDDDAVMPPYPDSNFPTDGEFDDPWDDQQYPPLPDPGSTTGPNLPPRIPPVKLPPGFQRPPTGDDDIPFVGRPPEIWGRPPIQDTDCHCCPPGYEWRCTSYFSK